MLFVAHTRNPGKLNSPSLGSSAVERRSPSASSFNPLQAAARRVAARCAVPYHVALAHAEAAGLGREAR